MAQIGGSQRNRRRGRTERALSQLGLNRNQVDVVVVREGKKGFLGLGSEEAIVRVTAKEDAPAPATRSEGGRSRRGRRGGRGRQSRSTAGPADQADGDDGPSDQTPRRRSERSASRQPSDYTAVSTATPVPGVPRRCPNAPPRRRRGRD